jgi:hypothetical protein
MATRPETHAAESPTAALCTRCGLCCDGTLLADVELAGRAEATRMELLGLRVDDDADRALMLLPCTGLAGSRCTVYAHRPRSCRAFECRLLRDVRRGTVSLARGLRIVAATRARIARVDALLARLGRSDSALPLHERVAEALAGASGGTAAAGVRAEISHRMLALRRAIGASFLGGAGHGARRAGRVPA